MTNAMIIFIESQKLAEEGKIGYTGRVFKGLNVFGQEVEYKETEAIHTFAAWKSMGFKVKKGSKAVASFPIWKYINTSAEAKDCDVELDQQVDTGKIFMKKAAFFTRSQVEEMEK